jgi:hypothetical protein
MTNHARIGFGSGSKLSKNNKTITALKMSEESKKLSVCMYRNETTKRKKMPKLFTSGSGKIIPDPKPQELMFD